MATMSSATGGLDVTVVICTWNRAASLARTLEHMTNLRVPDRLTWELIVINNASTDDTDATIDRFVGRLPIRRAWEGEPGLANARNRGVAEARGEFVIWTDDDIRVDENWLCAYDRAFRRWPDASVFGGPIEPLFEGTPPAWIFLALDRIGSVYGRQSLGSEPVQITASTIGGGPYGGNMAMRTVALRRFPFDGLLGVRHGQYAIGEESEVVRRMLDAGLTGWWSPEPRVGHYVPVASQTEAYVRRWMVGCGRYIARFPERDASLPTNHLPRLYARWLRHELSYLLRRRISPPPVWITHLVRASHARGRILEARADFKRNSLR